jgi:hypothetical protein
MIRIVGLSATLPNYEDVANFLHVSPTSGRRGRGGQTHLECICPAPRQQLSLQHDFKPYPSLLSQSISPLPPSGLFHFDASFRPVPLEMQFIGVTVTNFMARNTMMAEICYGKVRESGRGRGGAGAHLLREGESRRGGL